MKRYLLKFTKTGFLLSTILWLTMSAIQAQPTHKLPTYRSIFWTDESLRVEVYLVQKQDNNSNYSLLVVANRNLKIFYHSKINSSQPVLRELSPIKIIKGRKYYEFNHSFSKMTIWMALEFKLKGTRIESLTRTFYNDIFEIVPNDQFLDNWPK